MGLIAFGHSQSQARGCNNRASSTLLTFAKDTGPPKLRKPRRRKSSIVQRRELWVARSIGAGGTRRPWRFGLPAGIGTRPTKSGGSYGAERSVGTAFDLPYARVMPGTCPGRNNSRRCTP